jgi:hypothetical protein
MNRPGLLTGALVGGLLITPMLVISALATQLAGLPFAPFDLFPAVRDILPGWLLTFTIDRMVDTLIAFNVGRLDNAAKVAEQGMAVLMVLALGVAVGAVFFGAMRRVPVTSVIPGLLLGVFIGIIMAVISLDVGLTATTPDALSAAWLVVLFAGWGALLNWAYNRLVGEPVAQPANTRAKTA